MFKAGVAVLVIISLIVLGSLTVAIMGMFGLSGGVWDLLRDYINWGWLQKYQTFVAGSIGTCLLLSAAVIAIFQLRGARRTGYADLLVRLTEEWNSGPFIESRHLILKLAPLEMDEEEQRRKVVERMETAQQESHQDYFLLTRPLDFFEELAFLIRKHYVPLEDVRRTFGEPMVVYYKLFESCIKEMRKRPENANAYKELEEVVKQLTQGVLVH